MGPLLAEECVCGAAGGPGRVPWEAGSVRETRPGTGLRLGSPPRVKVSARGWGLCAWPGPHPSWGPRPLLGSVPRSPPIDGVPACSWGSRPGSAAAGGGGGALPDRGPVLRHPRGGSF